MFQPNTYRADVASFGTFAVYTVLFVSVVTVVVIFENVVSLSAFLRYGKCCSLIKIFIGYRCFCLRINKFQILSQLLIQRRHIPVHKRFHIRRGSDWTTGFFIDPTGHFDCRQRIVIHSSCRIDLFAHSHLVQKFHHIGALYLRRNLNGIDPVDFYFLFHNFCIRIHGNIHTFDLIGIV